MAIAQIKLGSLAVSRFIIGGNPFRGISHISSARDAEMRAYYTNAQVVATLFRAEAQGVTAMISRTDEHILSSIKEYRAAGGKLDWIAQTAYELPSLQVAVETAVRGGARGCYIHGGQVENYLANGRGEELKVALAQIKAAGMVAGIAGHVPTIFDWAEENLQCDFYMCSYYHPTPRENSAGHDACYEEIFDDADRDRMVARIATLQQPVIHYKILAAGRKTPEEAFAFATRQLRPLDAVCVGIFDRDNSDMLAEDLRLLQAGLAGK